MTALPLKTAGLFSLFLEKLRKFSFLHFYIFLGRTSARPFRALLVLTIYQFFGELFGDLIFSSYICSILN
jgi:hypothetical protein